MSTTPTDPAYTYAATIIRWVDGDTVDARVDLGFRLWEETRFRLYGIDTPERGAPGWAEATARCNALAPAGAPVILTTHPAADKYGRWLTEVWVNGTSVNATLIAENLAVPYFGGTK